MSLPRLQFDSTRKIHAGRKKNEVPGLKTVTKTTATFCGK